MVCGAPEEGALNESDQAPRKHVFAVNSSPDFLLVVREVLADEGYAVTTSNFEPNVFTRIVMRHPDALIIDVAPGESAGWDLLRRLLQEATTSGIPVLATSTSPALLEQAQDEAAWYGTNRFFLTKPLDLDELVRTIWEMVGDDV
jgi:CheY-like chemotaxis protein